MVWQSGVMDRKLLCIHLQFMETYLGCLKQNGLLLIATQVMDPSFYDDFGHVKPYTHIGILSIFGGKATQVQYHSQHTLELIDLYYLRLAYQLKFYRTLEMHTVLYRIPRTINRLFHLIYRLSFRLIGQPKAWIGLFRKFNLEDIIASGIACGRI